MRHTRYNFLLEEDYLVPALLLVYLSRLDGFLSAHANWCSYGRFESDSGINHQQYLLHS